MSASNVGPGGVRNLRAMFENKATDQSNSPPSRGRSPNGSVSSAQEGPLSKVRASFVTVEKAGESGSSESSVGKDPNNTMNGTTGNAIVEEQNLGDILKGSPFLDEGAFPAPDRKVSESSGVGDRAAAMVKKMQQGNTNPPPVEDNVEDVGPQINRPIGPPKSKEKPQADPINNTSESSSSQPTKPKGPLMKPRGGPAKIKGIMESAARAREANAAAAAREQNAAEGSSRAESSTQPTESATQAAITPAEDTRNGSSKKSDVTASSKTSRVLKSTSEVEGRKGMTNSDSKSRAETVKTPTITRAPRMSLPTRRPPTATTAPMAASVARQDETRPTETHAIEKKTSKVPPRVANITTASSLAKKSSRTSLNSNEESRSRTTTKPANEGFLARMMRPTASSAQKAHDKIQVQSPPRPRQTSGKTLSTRPSRKSLSQADENKENESDVPPVPAISQEAGGLTVPIDSQPAEGHAST